MKNLFYSFLFLFLFSGTAWAQLSGDRTVPSEDYPNLQTVADSLNLYGVGAGGINFAVAGGSSFEETAIVFTATGTSDDPVSIAWDGVGEKPTVNFEASEVDSEAGITLSGVDYYTIDGLVVTNTNADLEYGILIVNATEENGASNNTVKNMEITLDKLNLFSTSAISVVANIAPISFDGNNHHNKFYNNAISNTVIGYTFDGNTSTTTMMCIGNEVGIEAGGQSIISDLVMAGITAADQNGFSITHTTIRDLTRIGDGTTAPAAIATSSGNPSEPLTNEFIIANNTIEDMTSSFTSIFGIYISARKATHYINNNKIDNITATGGGGNSSDGIMLLATDAVANIYNNMVSGIAAPASAVSNNCASRGITVRTFEQANIFHNSVVLDYDASNPAHQSAAMVIYSNSDLVQMRNNIFINRTGLTGDATGFAAAVFKRNNTLAGLMEETDKNIYYAGTPDPKHVIYWGNNSSAPLVYITMEDYEAGVATFDQNSYTEDVQFVAANDLHIPAFPNTTVALNNGSIIMEPIEVLTDFDGSVRGPGASDIGADEIASLMPDVAINPTPEDNAIDVSVALTEVSWEYIASPEYSNPENFEVYIGLSPVFEGPNLAAVIAWEEGTTNYTASIPALASETLYYWQVVPITENTIIAEDVPIWSFTTELFIYPYPNPAENPTPADLEVIVPGDGNVITLGWDYNPAETHSLPAYFEVYGATDESSTDWETSMVQVDYVEGQVAYEVEFTANPNFTYYGGDINYWKVVPVSATIDATPEVTTWSFEIDITFSLNDITLDGTVIYPNPAVDIVNVAPSFEGSYEVKLYDVQGRLVQNFGKGQGQRALNISDVAAGTYQMVISQGDARFVSLLKVR